MSFDVLDEHEQGELVQKWLRENAMAIIAGVAIGLALIFGWQQWKAHRASETAAAAAQYQALADAVSSKKTDDAVKIAESVRSQYPDSTYAVLAALQMARVSVEKNDLDAAAVQLDWARQHAKTVSLQALIDLRIGRIKLAKGDAEGALKLAESVPAGNYDVLSGELRGDSLAKLGRADDARKAYESALAAGDTQSIDRNTLQMKLDDLGAAAPSTSTEKPAT